MEFETFFHKKEIMKKCQNAKLLPAIIFYFNAIFQND